MRILDFCQGWSEKWSRDYLNGAKRHVYHNIHTLRIIRLGQKTNLGFGYFLSFALCMNVFQIFGSLGAVRIVDWIHSWAIYDSFE